MAITYKELQRCRDLCAQLYKFEKALESFNPADMPDEIFFDADAIRQGLQKKQGGTQTTI